MQGELLQSTTLALVYEGTPIGRRAEMLSLTDMWNASGADPSRQPAEWSRSADAQRFITFLVDVLNLGNSQDDLFSVRRGGKSPSTWAHWQVGLAYAKYLSPEFHVWCNTVIRAAMEGRPARTAKPQDLASAFGAYFEIARLIGLDRNQSALSAGCATKASVGENPLDALGVTHLLAPQQDALLTAADIGKRLGGKSAIAVNQLLQERGFQVGMRDLKDHPSWEPTEAGRPHAVFLDTGKKHSDGTPVRQLKWSASVLDALVAEPALSRPSPL